MDVSHKSSMFVPLIVVSSATLIIGLVLFTVTAQIGYLWWLAGLSVAIGVGALLGTSDFSDVGRNVILPVAVTLVAYGLVRTPIRFLTGKTVDIGHEAEVVLYCISLVLMLTIAWRLSNRVGSKTEPT